MLWSTKNSDFGSNLTKTEMSSSVQTNFRFVSWISHNKDYVLNEFESNQAKIDHFEVDLRKKPVFDWKTQKKNKISYSSFTSGTI